MTDRFARQTRTHDNFLTGEVLMNTRRLAWSLLIAIPAMGTTVVTSQAAQADTLTVMREGSDMSGEGAGTVRFWTGDDRIARIDENGRMIGDQSAAMFYLIDDQARTCHALSTRDPDGDHDRDREALAAAVKAVEFRKTGKSEQIGDWQAEVHELTAGSGDDAFEMVVWISDEIPVDEGQRAYMESVATPEMAWMLAIYDLGGFPVRQEVRMGSMQMWAELQSIEEKPAPPGTYQIPEGYTGCE